MTLIHIRNLYRIFFTTLFIFFKYGESNSGLLTSTLHTFEVSACDGETLQIKCPLNTMISIQLSQYGRQAPSYQQCPVERNDDIWEPENTNCLATTSLRVLFDACQNKQSCQVLASTSTFRQDPCPFISKYLKVKYKCSPSDFKNLTVCENDQLNIRCERSKRIAVYSVLYGRTTTNTPKCLTNGAGYADCRSSTAIEEVMKRCHGRNHCVIEAEEYVFGNPCPPGVQKYLTLSYTCVPKKILKDRLRHHGKNGFHRKRKKKKKKPDKTENIQSIPETSTFIEKVLNTAAPVNNNMYPADDAKQQGALNKGELIENPNKSSKKEEDEKSNTSIVLCINTTTQTVKYAGQGKDGAIGLVVDWFNSFNFISKNEEKAVLYLVIGICFGVICLLIVVVIKLIIRNKLQRKSKLDVTDPVLSNPLPPPNHIEPPTMSRTGSIDRIEVVRFEPRGTFRQGERYHPRSLRNLDPSDDPFDLDQNVDQGDPFQRRGTLLSLDQNDRTLNNYYG